jgi:peptidoglycan/LPS O-acetylase OafA/YrhL
MKPILLFSFISVLINLNQNHFCQMIGVNFMYLNYILIGTIFYFAFQSRISHTALIFYVVIEMIFLVLSWKFSALKNQFPVVTYNYFFGLIIFSLSYYYREKFKPLKPLDWFAEITFPIYIIHSLVGYSIIKLLMAFNYSFQLSLLITLPLVILMAYLIHIFIEAPSTRYGKELFSK